MQQKRIIVEFQPEERNGNETKFGFFVCPSCRQMNYLAYSEPERNKAKNDSCIKCGLNVRYSIPGKGI